MEYFEYVKGRAPDGTVALHQENREKLEQKLCELISGCGLTTEEVEYAFRMAMKRMTIGVYVPYPDNQ